MGSFCGCCSRRSATISTDTAQQRQDETQAMLGATDSSQNIVTQPKQTNSSVASSEAYGSTDKVSYATLKADNFKGSPKIKPIATKDLQAKLRLDEQKDKEADDEEEAEEAKISTQQSSLLIANAGFDTVNGDYRWFVHSKKWCMFREDTSYSMENGVNVQDVYDQLNKLQANNASFRWESGISKAWIISTMDGSAIYYAAPQTNTEWLPSKQDWISVHGSLPPPEIYPNLVEESKPPEPDEQFGNVPTSPLAQNHRKSASSISSLPSITESHEKIEGVLETDEASEEQKKGGDEVDDDDEEKDEEDEEEESVSDLDD